jgi:hypothetical protein
LGTIKNISLSAVFFLSIFSSLCYSQDELKDSILSEKTSLQPMEDLILSLEQFDFYRELNSFQPDLPINYDSNTVWLWTSYALSKSEFNEAVYGETPANVSRFLYNEYMEELKFNPVKYALGVAQAGAVGYLAYIHIKKYGFLK